MKVFLRVTIVILLLCALGLGTYAIFFKPANKDSVFLALSKVKNEEQQNFYDEALVSIDNRNFEIKRSAEVEGQPVKYYPSLLSIVEKQNLPEKLDNEATDEQKKEYNKKVDKYIKYVQFTTILDIYKSLFDEYDLVINGELSDTLLSGKYAKIPYRNMLVSTRRKYLNEVLGREYVELRVDDPTKKESLVDKSYDFNQYTYHDIKLTLDEAFDYYFAYTQAVAKKIPNSELKSIKSSINEYQNSFALLREKFAEIKELQDFLGEIYNQDLNDESLLSKLGVGSKDLERYIEDNQKEINVDDAEKKETIKSLLEDKNYVEELTKRYQVCIAYFRDYLNKYSSLICKVSNFVTEYVFNGEQLADMDSIFYDLMCSAVKNATENKYVFSDFESRKAEDLKMVDATKFIQFSIMNKEKRKDQLAENRFYFEEKEQVEVVGKNVYSKINNLKYVEALKLQIKDDKLYFGVGEPDLAFETEENIEITKKDGVYTVNICGVNYTSSQLADDANKHYIVVNRLMVFKEDDKTKIRIYDKLADRDALTLDTVNTLKDISIDDSANTIKFSKDEISYTTNCVSMRCYLIDGELYGINSNWEVCRYKKFEAGDLAPEFEITKVEDEEVYTILEGSKYHAGTFYASKNYEDKGKPLDYGTMIKYYRSLMADSPESIDLMMKLTLEEKRKFVNEDADVRVKFNDKTHDAIAYILACFGFVAEK